MSDFLHLGVTLVEEEHTARHLLARYVEHEEVCYVVHSEVLAAMARRPPSLRAFLRGDPSVLHDLVIVDSQDPELHGALDTAFVEKYDVHAHSFVGLRPVPAA
jgi:hypothetical protein